MTHYIDTAEQFVALRETLKPAVLRSKRYGEIPAPCTVSLLARRDLIKANNYNPNSVSKDKMKLLRQSIRDNGFCFAIVTIWDDAEEKFVIVDGYHRNIMGSVEWLDLDYVPIVVLNHDISQRMYATVQFNKARGVHQVDLDADLIRSLIEQGNTEDEIAEHLGLDLETIYRYKQLTGIAELFSRTPWSLSWNAVENPDIAGADRD